jgi:kynurenine formamidase
MQHLRRLWALLTACGLPLLLASNGVHAAPSNSAFITLLTTAKIVELNFVWDRTSPLLSFNPPYAMALVNTQKQTTGMIPGLSFAADMMYFSGQHGAPTIDALGHIGQDGKLLYGGLEAAQHEGPDGLHALGIEHYPAARFVHRGVLLDAARAKHIDALAPGQEITAEDLEAIAKAQGVEIRAGDSMLIRTGYGQYFETDRAKYLGWRPGPGESAARWLAAKKIFLTGTDQLTYEVVPAQGTVFPAHRILLAENGIYIVENLNLEALATVLAERKSYEFVLVLNPIRIRGATGAPLNAFAIIPAQ